MVSSKTTGAVRHLAESFSAVSSASEGAFLYYKFGRHEGVFSEKPYFLLSYCAHVLFTLWRFEEEDGGTLFLGRPRPTAFLAGLDFGALRYHDYKRRMLHADCIEDHWRNETQWFEFWIQVLEHWDPSNAPVYQEFSRHILACAAQSDVLEKKLLHRSHAACDRFLKTDAVGSVMLRTLSILDEVMRGIIQCFAGLDPKTYLLERITVLTALLNETRRIVVYQTPAKGPYTPLGATRWRAPSPLGRLFWGRTQGILTVVPKREGGDVVCTYDPPSQPKNHRRSWMRATSSLAGTYEQELFATWSYETGECHDDPGHPTDVKARWTLQNEEAARLEVVSRRIDVLFDGLDAAPSCKRLLEEVRDVSRNGDARWKGEELPWTYIHRLDQLLGRLRFICREAKVMGGDDAAEKAVAAVWPVPTPTTDKRDLPRCSNRVDRVKDTVTCDDQPPVAETRQTPEASRRTTGTQAAPSAVAQTSPAETRDKTRVPLSPVPSPPRRPGRVKSASDGPVPAARAKQQPSRRTGSPKKPRTGIDTTAVAVAQEIWRRQAAGQAAAEGLAGQTCEAAVSKSPQEPPAIQEKVPETSSSATNQRH
jgi:hypothetical protein